MFRSLFRKFSKTRAKPIDPNDTDMALPARGDDDGKRGWRHHVQHGLYGHVQHWAQGSPYCVAFMLAGTCTLP